MSILDKLGIRKAPTSEAPMAEWSHGLATTDQGVDSLEAIHQYVVKPNPPSGELGPLQGKEDSVQPQRYPAPSGPMSNVGQHPNAGQTQPRRAQPDSQAGD